MLRQQEETAKCVATALALAFDTQKTYGADPESLSGRVAIFTRILKDYSADSVQSAFDYFFENNSGLPEPSDIVKIIKDRQVYNRPEYKVLPKDEAHPLYYDLSEKDQAQVDAWIAQARKILRADEPKTRSDKPTRNHFAAMPAEVQEKVKSNWIESVKKLRAKIYGEYKEIKG